MRFSSVSTIAVGLMVITGSVAMAQAKPAAKAAARPAAVAKPTGDAVAGQKAFEAKCRMCHMAGGVGGALAPDLRGVYGRASGKSAFTRYSPGIKAGAIVWAEPTLDTYLQGPAKMVPGSIMVIPPIAAPDRKNIIAYLATLK